MIFEQMLKEIPARASAIRESLGFDSIETAREGIVVHDLPREYRTVRTKEAQLRQAMKFAKFMKEVYGGQRPMHHLREAMTVSDFPNLFGDLLYRQLLGNYVPYPTTYQRWCRIVEVNDFRKLHLYAIDGGQGLLGPAGTSLQAIKEREPYPEVVMKETPYSIQVLKYGRRFGITFEMVINDDLNAFSQRPVLMAVGARRSEEYLASTMICDANGPHASFYTTGNKNKVTIAAGGLVDNPTLSIDGLQAAMNQLAAQTDADGQPIVIDAVELVVPPALEITAQNILNATQLRINSSSGVNGGGSIDQFMYTTNWMRGRVNLNVNSYIPIISTATKNGVKVGNTQWHLIANPNNLASRPAVVFGFMRGRRQPQLFIKDSNQRVIGGGDADAMEGDFNTDSIDYKMRHIFGATQVDPKMAVSSDGSQAA